MTDEEKTFNFKNKVAIVTGSAQGIGKSIAHILAKNCATVVISDVQTEKGRAVSKELGDPSIFVHCDISDARQVYSLVDTVVQRFDRLDIMVNNAGINSGPEDRVTIDKYPEELWKRIIDVDLNGTFFCCKSAASVMIKQKAGTIINIASVAGVVALRLQVAYVAAKAAVLKITEAMACELGPHGIRVNAVSPGSTLTEGTRALFYGKKGGDKHKLSERLISYIPQGRPAETDEIAHAVAFLASDEASYINGHNFVVDGGWTSGFNRDF